jgi:hypothetical protein
MKMNWILIAVVYLLLSVSGASAQSSQPISPAGEMYEIIRSYKTSEETSGGLSGSSGGSDTFLERVIAEREGGLELEYDLPLNATAEERARNWQLPARVLKPLIGQMQLLNRDQLEARLESWLKAASWDRSVCGRWIFTWNAFHIDCDPLSIIETIKEIDLRSQAPREGDVYSDAQAVAPGLLTRKIGASNGATFIALLKVDPRAVHRARAEADVASGEIMQKPITLETALGERTKEQVSGTISVTLETDAAGKVRKRTKVTTLEIKRPGGTSESRKAMEIVERRRVSTLTAQR